MKKNICIKFFLIVFVFYTFSCNQNGGEIKKAAKNEEIAKKGNKVKKISKEEQIAFGRALKWGEEYFYSKKLGTNGKSCVDCHKSGKGFKEKISTYPKYNSLMKRVITLSQMIDYCAINALKRKKHLDFDSTKMISLLAYISSFEGSAKPDASTDPESIAALIKAVELGKKSFDDNTLGTTGRVCNDCHEGGEKLAGKAKTFPKYVAMANRVVTLGHMVRFCQYGPLKALKPVPLGSEKMTGIIAYISTFN